MGRLGIAAAALLMLSAGGCANKRHPGALNSADRCPNLPASSPPYGVEKLLVLDFINNLAPAGSPLDLRPASRTDNPRNPGVCVDGITGDIHIYGSNARQVTILLRFNPALSINAIWPIYPKDAFQVSFSAGGPWAAPRTAPTYFNPRTLQIVIDYTHGERPYYYRLQYVDPNDPDAKPHPIVAVISNH